MRIAPFALVAALLFASQAHAQASPQAPPADSFWSRVTVEVPLVTRHFPNDKGFNDHNWGGWVDVAVNSWVSVDAGDFINSYRRNTAFAAVGLNSPSATFSHVKLWGEGLIGADLNAGYRGYNSVDPFLGAVQLRLTGANFDSNLAFLNRLGVAVTVIPSAPDFPINLALTYRF